MKNWHVLKVKLGRYLIIRVGVVLKLIKKILMKIFGPTKEDKGIWRIKTNKELDN